MVITVICLVLLSFEFLHGFYYNIKTVMHHDDLAYIRDAGMSYRKFPGFITDLKKQNPDRQILVCSPEEFYLHTASQPGCKPIFDYESLNRKKIVLSQKGLLVVLLHPQDVPLMKEYIQKDQPGLKTIIYGTS